MKYLPVLEHAISFIFRSGGKADLTSVDRLMFGVIGKHVYDVQTMRWSLFTGL